MSYSIVIRTLGAGGGKYQSLLDSISIQSIKPENVFIVIPDGYELPTEQLGYEKFVRTRKGMLHQRVFGLEYAESNCNSDYLLCLDDDISFGKDYAEAACRIMNETKCDMLMPTVLENGQSKAKVHKILSKENLYGTLRGIRRESRQTKYRVSIMRTAGFKSNSNLKGEIPTQSCHGTGFWIKNGIAKTLDIQSEYWVEKCRYALPEDQVFGYKAYLIGFKMLYSTNIAHVHLDASTSTGSDRLYHSAFASGRNFLIFWHRFIYSVDSKILDKFKDIIAISYRLSMQGFGLIIVGLLKRNLSNFRGFREGFKDAIKYLSSQDYKSLPAICKKIDK